MTPGRTVKPTLDILSPAAGGSISYPSFVPKIQYTVGSRVHSIEYAIDDKVITTTTSPPWVSPLRIPKTIGKAGGHAFRVTVTDQYFNVVSEEVTITFSLDRSGPGINLLLPKDGMEIAAGSSIVIHAESEDPEGAVKYVEFYLDTLLLSRDASAPYELTYPANVTPGSHTVRALATDLAGNTGEDEVTITVK